MILFERKPKYTIQHANREDCSLIAEIHSDSFYTGWSRDEVSRMISNSNTLCLVLRQIGNPRDVAAFIILRLALDEAEILTLAVANQNRRKGLARMLLDEAHRQLYTKGIRHIFLEVAEDNSAAVNLYRKCEFRTVSRREGYYKRSNGQHAAAYVMRADL